MLELFWAAVAPVNLPYTILLGLVLVYWLLYVVGFLGSEALDFLNVDLEADPDLDVDTTVATAGLGSWLVAVLRFLHVGDVPILIILTVLIITMWTISVVIN